jgi:flagellar hook-associated protein 1 FlgK
MADLLSILSGAASSLSAQRGLSATASHNIDNANNPNYSRQIASVEAIVPAEQVGGAFIGRGATLGSVTQARDRFLEAQIPQALGSAAFSTAQSDALQAYHGLDPNQSGGLPDALSGFYAALSALAQDPSDSGRRFAFLGAARTVAQTFHRTSQTLEAARGGLDARTGALVGDVNSEAAAVAELNQAIRRARGAASGEPNDLLDQRQAHLDELVALTGAAVVPTSDGDVTVTLPGGMALVAADQAGRLSAAPDASNGGHLRVTLTLPDGTSAGPLANAALGGTLGGTLQARDGDLAAAGADIDHLAADFAAVVNAQHAAGFQLGGAPGGALFDAGAGWSGAAGRLALVVTDPARLALASAATGASGDAGNANALLATSQRALATSGKDAQGTIAALVSSFGAASATARAFADQDGGVRDHLLALRESTSGVSIDDELIALQRAQRGYEAISKVIQTADDMLQTLLQLR